MSANSIFNALNEMRDKKKDTNEDYNYKVTDTGNTEKVKEPGNKLDKKHKEMVKKKRKNSYKQNMETLDDEEVEKEEEEKNKKVNTNVGDNDDITLSDEEIVKLRDILKALKVPESIETALDDEEFSTVYEFLEDKYGIKYEEKISEDNEEEINEMSDWKKVADLLVNAVEDGVVDEDDFVKSLEKQTGYTEEELRDIFNAYWEVDPITRMNDLSRDSEMKSWLGSQLESNSVNEKEEDKTSKKKKVNNSESNNEEDSTLKLDKDIKLGVMEDGYATTNTAKWDISLLVYEGGEDEVKFEALELDEDRDIVKLNMVFEEENVDREVYMEVDEMKKVLI